MPILIICGVCKRVIKSIYLAQQLTKLKAVKNAIKDSRCPFCGTRLNPNDFELEVKPIG